MCVLDFCVTCTFGPKVGKMFKLVFFSQTCIAKVKILKKLVPNPTLLKVVSKSLFNALSKGGNVFFLVPKMAEHELF